MNSVYLAHHGIKGQKWGVRRYQNPDGSLTDEGRKRYGSDIRKGYRDSQGYLTAVGRVVKDPRNKDKGAKGLFRLDDYEVNPKNNKGKKSFEQLKRDYPGLDDPLESKTVTERWQSPYDPLGLFKGKTATYTVESRSDRSASSYDNLSSTIEEVSGDWYFDEGKSPGFKKQLKVIENIRNSPEYGYGVKWAAEDDLVGVVLNDLGYEDTAAARKYIRDVVIWD